MRKSLIVATAAIAILMLGATAAQAASPHIVGTPTATVSGNTLTLSASVAGLGNVPSATFDLVGTVDVSSRCYTKSGNKPQAANKRETISVDQTVTFDVRNGRTNATFTVTPLSTLSCPAGQVVVIESVTYNLDLNYGDLTLFTFTS
jgi:opacity protein-like surface antigen